MSRKPNNKKIAERDIKKDKDKETDDNKEED